MLNFKDNFIFFNKVFVCLINIYYLLQKSKQKMLTRKQYYIRL